MKTTIIVLVVLAFLTISIQAKDDACSQPKEVGPCRAQQTFHYYNSETKQCEEFFYGGCRGNDNRFDSKELCESTCL